MTSHIRCVSPVDGRIYVDRPTASAGEIETILKNARAATPEGTAPPAEASPEPSLGMTTAQVRALLGAPAEISQEEVVDGHTLVWTYPGARAFQFDTSGILVGK